MANPNEWSPFYNNNNNQTYFTTSTITSTAVTTTTTASPSGEPTSIDSRLSPETGRVTKPARKRSRASRRTPTTLLNTDTSNFRSMVQRFTGGPSAIAFGSAGNNTTSGFSLTDPSAGSSQQVPWQYSYNQPHVAPPPQRPYMFSLSDVNPVVGYSNVNNPNYTAVPGVFGTTADGGAGGSGTSSKEEMNSNTSSSRLQ
ncbi:hypothetical protein N665_7391s0001 [Sinapis alba]|nr:hypothetical protein N665_7391s0001 [Sinapis alba]